MNTCSAEITAYYDASDIVVTAAAPNVLSLLSFYSPGARGSYPAPRVKVFYFADSGSPEARLQFPGG